ncbi:twin-arginine translocase subunit TatC [candidate division KSB1 bacterium]
MLSTDGNNPEQNENSDKENKESEPEKENSEAQEKEEPEKGEKTEKYMPFTDHLEELRKRIFICLGSVVSLAIIAYMFSDQILNILTKHSSSNLQILKPTGGFIIHIKVSFFAGIVFGVPVLIYQFWKFVAPGLFPKEKKFVFPIILFTIICFITGAMFAYFMVIPHALDFLRGFETETIIANWTIEEFIRFITMMVLIFGFVFELPLVALFLGRIGIINHKMMSKYRRHALLGSLILGALLTPPDGFTQIMLAVPMWILYEISIFIVRVFGKKPAEEEI